MTKTHFIQLVEHISGAYGPPTMFFTCHPQSERLRMGEAQAFGDLVLHRLDSKLLGARRRRELRFNPVCPTLMVAEAKTKCGNATLVHFHGLSWVQEVHRLEKELPRQVTSACRAWGLLREPDVLCDKFNAALDGTDYIGKHISEDEMCVSISPFAHISQQMSSTL